MPARVMRFPKSICNSTRFVRRASDCKPSSVIWSASFSARHSQAFESRQACQARVGQIDGAVQAQSAQSTETQHALDIGVGGIEQFHAGDARKIVAPRTVAKPLGRGRNRVESEPAFGVNQMPIQHDGRGIRSPKRRAGLSLAAGRMHPTHRQRDHRRGGQQRAQRELRCADGGDRCERPSGSHTASIVPRRDDRQRGIGVTGPT